MASPFEFSYVFTVIGKIWEAMPVTLLLTFAPLFIGFLFGVPFAVIRRFNVPFAASFLKNESNILKGIPAVLLVLMINYLILKACGKTTRNNVFVLVSPMEYAASYCPFPTERRAPRTVSVICTTA